ncbi:MAG: hypothetical protein EXR73_13850 [Myxococcales bacterium]|nr:hypothetical protein [Myxococcales bacterium]
MSDLDAAVPIRTALGNAIRLIEAAYDRGAAARGSPEHHTRGGIALAGGSNALLDGLGDLLRPGSLAALAGSPKWTSGVLMRLTLDWSITKRVPILLVSSPSTPTDLAMRLLAAEIGLDVARLHDGRLGQADWIAITKGASTLTGAALGVIGQATVAQIVAGLGFGADVSIVLAENLLGTPSQNHRNATIRDLAMAAHAIKPATLAAIPTAKLTDAVSADCDVVLTVRQKGYEVVVTDDRTGKVLGAFELASDRQRARARARARWPNRVQEREKAGERQRLALEQQLTLFSDGAAPADGALGHADDA